MQAVAVISLCFYDCVVISRLTLFLNKLNIGPLIDSLVIRAIFVMLSTSILFCAAGRIVSNYENACDIQMNLEATLDRFSDAE